MSTIGSNIKPHSLSHKIVFETWGDCDTDETHSSTTNGEEEDRDRMIDQANSQHPRDAEITEAPPAPAPTFVSQPSNPEGETTTLTDNLSELYLGDNHDAVVNTPVAPVSAPSIESSYEEAKAPLIEEKGELSPLYVGRVIGKGGEMIRDLQARSGCHIDVNQNVERSAPKIITYRGRNLEDIDLAKRLVAMLCTEDAPDRADLPLGRATMKQIRVPNSVIGRIIGRGGETICELQSDSEARIQIDHSVDDATGLYTKHRQVTITGTVDSVAKAEEMIMFLSMPYPNVDGREVEREENRNNEEASFNDLPYWQGQWMHPARELTSTAARSYWVNGNDWEANTGYDGGYVSQQGLWNTDQYTYTASPPAIMETDGFPCDKTDIGYIIGRKGATINDLQRRSNCSIQIDQQDCQVIITGPRQGIQMAKRMLQNIIENRSNHPCYAAGRRLEQQEESSADQELGYEEAQQTYPSPKSSYGVLSQTQQYYGKQPMMPYQQQQQPYAIPQAPRQYPAQAPSPWKLATTADGQMYYYNQDTLETRWDKPIEMR
mmetsp:Transcript_13492/g.25813  ORF Transcript_13492/g.25813 Transcript_13492/m.25813 type:complete len:547 (+) Transcript_13492:127-1767(+)|eukprot:CAMPEP_0201662732 /NCGR_PEP_ID=MMETSP0494-20130426/4749_1 /ASSEMBLY_ACC=CAM_ASM_000839 /TAXON_ID=420259 /ORGANISM="Thalassiosira gravida, Strain GMp14c1" /LENGTH=546 /DNA_ID=CAMNT_0048141175 /DNA_START=23 /DNA_END=1663 /DNA_ORIENTATION=+